MPVDCGTSHLCKKHRVRPPLQKTPNPMTSPNVAPTWRPESPALCGYNGRKALIRHWEKTLSEHRDGSLAIVEWRGQQRFTAPVPAAMVELLSYLFAGAGEMPYSVVHKRLLGHMIMRVQYLLSKVEKAVDTQVGSSRELSELLKDIVRRFTYMATSAVRICDLSALHGVTERLVSLLHRCKVAQTRLQAKYSDSHQEICPTIYSAFFTPQGGECGRFYSMTNTRAIQCSCTHHLPAALTLMIAGIVPTSPLYSLQTFAESSTTPALLQAWYGARIDRLLIKIAWHCYEVQTAILEADNGLDPNLRTLEAALPSQVYGQLAAFAESIGSCTGLYALVKQVFALLNRLITHALPAALPGELGLEYLAQMYGEIAEITVGRPPPIKSGFYNEEALEGRTEDLPGRVADAFRLFITALSGWGDGALGSMRLQLGLLCRKSGLMDRSIDGPLMDALFTFAERLGQTSLTRSHRPRLSLGAVSPSRSSMGGHTLAQPNGLNIQTLSASTVRAFFVQRLTQIPLLASSADHAAARTGSKLDPSGDLWDAFLLLQSPIWTYIISAALFESFLAPYSATTLRNDGRLETDCLCAWLVLIAIVPLLVATVPGPALPAHAGICVVKRNYTMGMDSTSCSQVLATHVAQREWSRARQGDSLVKRRRNSPSAGCAPLLTFEKLLEALNGRRDSSSGIPASWSRILQMITAGDETPLKTVRMFLSTLQEVYDTIQQENSVETWSNPKVSVRAVLGRMHQQFKSTCGTENDDSLSPPVQVQRRVSARLWRTLMVCLANYLLDGGWGGGGPGIESEVARSLSSQDAFMLNYLLMEFRTEKYVGEGNDHLPAAALMIIQRLQAKRTPLSEAMLAGNRQNLKELYCRWLTAIGEPGQGLRSAALRERLGRDLGSTGLIPDLKDEERIKMRHYIGNRRHDPLPADTNLCLTIYFLRFGILKPPHSDIDRLATLFLGCANS